MNQLVSTCPERQPSSSGGKFLPGKLLGAAMAVLGLFSSFQAEAQQVVIGATSGASSPYFGPTYNFGGSSTTDNSRHAHLYTAAELGIPAGATITEIAWLKADAGSVTGSNNFNLLLKNTTASSLVTATNWGTLTTGATQVYGSTSQSITGAADTYMAFPLTTPFTYTGDNLQIMTDWVRAANPSDATTYYSNSATGKAIGTASTGTLTNTSNLNTTTYGNSRPTIRISYLAGNDAGISAITSPAATVAPGVSQPVTVTLKNFGTNPLTSATINWSVNGVAQTPYGWTGNLAPQQTATGIALGNFTFAAGNHTLTAATTSPNGSTDADASNDAFSMMVGACAGSPLAGSYTINAAAAASATNFQSFTDAAAALNGCGVSAPVTLTVAAGSGPYTGQFTLSNIAGVSAANTVTFEGSGDTLTANPTAANPAIIKLDNADYIRINNLKIVVDTAATEGWGIQLVNGSDFAVISNNTISLPFKGGNNLNGIVAGTANNVAGNNTNNSIIQNNTIIGGFYGISINGLPANQAFNNRITGNTVRDATSIMVYLRNVDSTLVEGNDLSRPTRTTTNSFHGIYMIGTNQRNVFSKNRIHTSGAVASAAYGINFRNDMAPAGFENLVKNNLIYNFQNTGATYGIVNVGNGGVNYYHNTVYFSKPNQTTNSVVQGVHQNEPGSNINFRNNIIYIDVPGTSTGGKHALFFNLPTAGISSDYNVLYVTPATFNGHIGYHSAIHYTTLSNWQTANSGAYDQNSLSADPMFANPATGDLTPTNMALNNTGVALAAVTTDITGAIRSTVAPDPGAYEFGPAPVVPATPTITAGGATTFCQGGSVTLTASSATTGVMYQWYNNGTAISGATSAAYNATAAGNYTVEAILNSIPSAASAPTTITINAAPAPPGVSYAGATTFCQGGTLALTASSATPGVTYQWFQSGNLISGATSATYNAAATGGYTVIALSNGCNSGSSSPVNITVNPKPATPTIFKIGNMLNSTATTGTYQWYTVSGTTLTAIPGATSQNYNPLNPGNYTVKVTQNGCESDAATAISVGVGIASLAPGMDVSVFPNPAAGKFEVKLTGFEKDATIQIMNVTGQVVAAEKVAVTSDKTSKGFDLSGIAKGLYILKVSSGDNLTFRKVILE